MRERTVGASIAVLVGAALWAVAAVPRSYTKAQLALGDDLRRLLVDHPAIGTTAVHDIVFAVAYAAAGAVLLLRFRALLAVGALLVTATFDVVENLALRVTAERVGDAQGLGRSDEVLRLAGAAKWAGVVLVVLAILGTAARRTRHAA